MSGGHRPGTSFKAKCVTQVGLTAEFSSEEVSVELLFSTPEDAAYFQVGTEYAFVASPVGGDSMGEDGDAQSGD